VRGIVWVEFYKSKNKGGNSLCTKRNTTIARTRNVKIVGSLSPTRPGNAGAVHENSRWKKRHLLVIWLGNILVLVDISLILLSLI